MPRIPLTAMGICGERRELDKAAPCPFLRATGTGSVPVPVISRTLGPHTSNSPTYTTSHPRLLDKLSCRQVALAMRQKKPVSRLPRSGVQRPSDLEGTCRCSHPNSSLFTDDGTESQDQVVARGHRKLLAKAKFEPGLSPPSLGSRDPPNPTP